MRIPGPRIIGLVSAVVAAAALGLALATERWGGLVPCSLCLLERWPYRVAIVLGLLIALVPRKAALPLLGLLVLTILVGAGLAALHSGVEFGWWPSPLPECAAPKFSDGSIADRLASMPARPAKPCDEPTFLIPFVPISMAGLNLLFGLTFATSLALYLGRRPTG